MVNTVLDLSLFLLFGFALVETKVLRELWLMTLLGAFLAFGWLLADDLDFLDVIPGTYEKYSHIRTGIFKGIILTGLLLDILRILINLHYKKQLVKNKGN